MSERKPFGMWNIAIVYDLQEGLCKKCGKPLGRRFHRHHVNGEPSDNSVKNLELYCSACHGGEAYVTYMDKKKAIMGDVGALISKATEGQLSGAAADKILDAIKLQLSLLNEVYDPELEQIPLEIRTQRYLESSGLLLKEYERGIHKGIDLGLAMFSIKLRREDLEEDDNKAKTK